MFGQPSLNAGWAVTADRLGELLDAVAVASCNRTWRAYHPQIVNGSPSGVYSVDTSTSKILS